MRHEAFACLTPDDETLRYRYGLNRHFQFTAYADVDTYVDTYADLKYRGRVSIISND